jgi:hypothetical protein
MIGCDQSVTLERPGPRRVTRTQPNLHNPGT